MLIKNRIFERGFGSNTGLGLYLIREIFAITGCSIVEEGVPGTGVSCLGSEYRKGIGEFPRQVRHHTPTTKRPDHQSRYFFEISLWRDYWGMDLSIP